MEIIIAIIFGLPTLYFAYYQLDHKKQKKIEAKRKRFVLRLTIYGMYILIPFSKGVKDKIVKKQKELDNFGKPTITFVSLDNDDD